MKAFKCMEDRNQALHRIECRFDASTCNHSISDYVSIKFSYTSPKNLYRDKDIKFGWKYVPDPAKSGVYIK